MSATIKYYLLFCLQFCNAIPAISQKLEEKLIITDGADAVLQNAFRSCFDTMGNYYFETMTNPDLDSYSLLTNTEKHNQVYWGYELAFQKYYSVLVNAFFTDKTKKSIYYKNSKGTKIYGPVKGTIKKFREYNKDNIAIEMCTGDTSLLYINNTLVNITDTALQIWDCSFSNNGNAIFSFYKNRQYRLYLNSKLIDTSSEPFTDLSVNDHKFFTYVKYHSNNYSICTPSKTFGPFKGSVGFNNLYNNDSYYFWGCDDSLCMILVNGNLYQNIAGTYYSMKDMETGKTTHRINEQIYVEFPENKSSIISYTQYKADSGIYMNINGSLKRYNYNLMSYIFTDKDGKYSFFGTNTDKSGIDRTYKNINGRAELISNPGYHTIGLQVTPAGQSLYYFESADSILLFQNDVPMYHPLATEKFIKWDENALPQNHRTGNEYFQGLNIDTFTVIAYNNSISKRLPLISLHYNRLGPYKKGNIVASEVSDKGFFIIEYVAPKKYLLVINNTIYQELNGIERIFSDQSYLKEHELIFYGNKGNGFYEFRYSF